MMNYPAKWICMVAINAVVCTACVSMDNSGSDFGGTKIFARRGGTTDLAENYGDDSAIRTAITTVKSQGSQNRVISRAIRLPERPLGEIAVYGYQFPAACGGHQFHVYEADGTQILEYAYDSGNGDVDLIRDYISGPSPFVQSGLWTAYDHTADSISTMTSRFERLRVKTLNGTYSQGLHTNLPEVEQRELGRAYNRAINDVFACRDI